MKASGTHILNKTNHKYQQGEVMYERACGMINAKLSSMEDTMVRDCMTFGITTS